MRIEFADCKQDLTLFLLELMKKIDVSKFPDDNSDGLNRYIYICLKNKYIELANKKKTEFKNSLQAQKEIENRNSIFTQPETIKNIEFNETLNHLSQKQKDVIIYKYIYGFSDIEIGEMFNMSRQAVNKLKNRAFETLKEYYE